MKNNIILICVAILLTCCVSEQQTSEVMRVAQSAPIKPIQLKDSVQTIVLTDYVPTIDDIDAALFDGVEMTDIGQELTLTAVQKSLNSLTIRKDEDIVSVAVLPNMPVKFGLYTIGCTGQSISFAIDNPKGDVSFMIFWQNTLLASPDLSAEEDGTYRLNIPRFSKRGRSFIRIYAADENNLYNDVLIPLENMRPITDTKHLNRHDQQSQVLYSLMIDRFCNGNKDNDSPLNEVDVLPIVDYQGGDFKGITQKIESGFFNDLGVTTIWISPITQNPYDAWGYYEFKGKPCKYKDINGEQPRYTKFSGYHGYWPIYATQIDKRLGTEVELREMLTTAHKHNLNIILDYVANHMHISSPTLQEHPDWHTDSILPDGRRNFELWDDARLTTWFDKHIPTLDLEREDVYEPMTDSALYWLENFEFDGFRHDACKHIPEVYWRTLTRKMKTRYPERSLWMIGETYGSADLIGSYIKTGMLDAQFDFNVYFTTIQNLVKDDGDMREIERVIEESMSSYGSHHTMGNISGNHDQIRFASLAGGDISFDDDGKEEGWTREVGIGDTAVAYKRALLLEVINLTIPGVPCLYQGDEFAAVGGNDPDNRQMMLFDGYNEQQQAFKSSVEELISMRRHSMALLYGDYKPLYADKDLLAYERIYMGERVLVIVNRGLEERELNDLGIVDTIPALGYIIR